MLTIRIDGHYAQTFGHGQVGEIEVVHRWASDGGGLHLLSFTIAAPTGYAHPALRSGALVQVLRGRRSLGWAVLSEPNRDDWTFTADGLYTEAEHFTADGLTSPRAVVLAAISRGLQWASAGDLPDVPVSPSSETTRELATVADVLNEYARQNNLRWGVDEHGVPYFAADPTEPTLALTPGVPKPATSLDDYATRVTVRYVSEVSVPEEGGTPEPIAYGLVYGVSAEKPHGIREVTEDATQLGKLTQAQAQTYADELAVAYAARSSFAEAIEVRRGDLTTLHGATVEPWLGHHGKRVRHHGVLDSIGQRQRGKTLEWVVGSTTYKPGEDSLVIAPVDLAARTLSQVQAAMKARTEKGLS